MKLAYLVDGVISRTPYMGETEHVSEQNIVMADSPEEAERKFREHYDKQTDEYSMYVHVASCNVKETLV